MLKVNLEKKLISENKKIHTPVELLHIKEYERIAQTEADTSVLERVGIAGAALEGRRVKRNANNRKVATEGFNQERVFHISQIESICKKYHLRFLPARLFCGSVDASLADKITTFEVTYDKKLNIENSYIIAPASSFKLEEKPKDPLFFYCINSEYFYLIHKWGNDLSFVRRFYRLLSSSVLMSVLNILFGAFLIGIGDLLNSRYDDVTGTAAVIFSIGIMFILIVPLWNGATAVMGDANLGLRFVKKNNWNSHYL